MKIRSIEWKNFGSYGNSTQKIEYDKDQGNFYLIVGGNGAGKSTISDVIKFGLYGKVDAKKLRDIPNRFNGNMVVKIVIEKNPTTIATIERGLSPHIFKLKINDVEYDQAGKKNIQDYIEEEILGIPFYVFNNMVSLSINDFKSFISMGVNDKRMIIDRLFGLEILGHIRWRIKNKLKVLKDYLDKIDTEISVLERSIASSNAELEALNEKLKLADEEKKKNLAEKIGKYEEFILKATDRIKEITDKEKELTDGINIWNHRISEQNTEIRICTQKIDLFKEGKCPTCESDLTSSEHKTMLEEFLHRNTEARNTIADIGEKVNALKERHASIKKMRDEVKVKKTTAEAHLSSCKTELAKLTGADTADNTQTESLGNIIEDTKNKKKEAIIKKSEEEKKGNFFRIVEEIFGDKGVKLSALKRIVPLLNAEIRKVLHDLNMDYRVTFNEEFDVDIQHLGFTVSPEQLSTGEKKKIDFAVLIALIRLMKIRFTGLNLTFLDEIFSSIDSDGIYHILKVLHKTCRELNLNIFVINHSQLPTEIFDYRLDIQKNNGFSSLSIEKIG